MSSPLRVLELFCGIGGCSAAINGHARVVTAIDINRKALAVYQHNFPHPVQACTIESLRRDDFQNWSADLWWLSPPCQPYTSRGLKRDLDDPRAASLVNILTRLKELRPPYLALENVSGFANSRACSLVHETLKEAGYRSHEMILCSSQLGIPNRRRRYYLIASQDELLEFPPIEPSKLAETVADFLLEEMGSRNLQIPPHVIEKYGAALHVVRPDDTFAMTTCFTSAYGRSPTASGSYVADSHSWRYFAPEEQLKLLGFPRDYQLPEYEDPRQLWPLIGNSLSVAAVRYVLSAIPELSHLSEGTTISPSPSKLPVSRG